MPKFDDSMLYLLSEKEQDQAHYEATVLQEESEKAGDENMRDLPEKDAFKRHLIGAAGEIALAGYLDVKNIRKFMPNTYKTMADLGLDIDVKTTACKKGFMIGAKINFRDDLKWRYPIVYYDYPRMYILGWHYGWYIKAHGDFTDFGIKSRPKIYFLHYSKLLPIRRGSGLIWD